MSRGWDTPMEELEAGREAFEDRLKPSKRDVAAAVKRADYCVYGMSIGYTYVDNPDMRHLGVLLIEKRRLEALAQWCKPDEHSPPEHWAAYRACFPDDASDEQITAPRTSP